MIPLFAAETAAEAQGTEKADPADSVSTVSRSDQALSDVNADHPEVKALVDQAVAALETSQITLPAETYIEVMEAAILEYEKDMRKNTPNGPV